MCCFRLHFSSFNVLFFSKKNLLQVTFEKNNMLCKKREKITCLEENPSPLPCISNGPPLTLYIIRNIEEYI